MKGSGDKMLKLNISDVITLYEGHYKGKKIYYRVIYNSLSIPEVYIHDKEKLDLLLRGRSDISISEYNTYISVTMICKTKLSDWRFDPTYKTKARRIEYY
jgi:hypothetical protein